MAQRRGARRLELGMVLRDFRITGRGRPSRQIGRRVTDLQTFRRGNTVSRKYARLGCCSDWRRAVVHRCKQRVISTRGMLMLCLHIRCGHMVFAGVC